MNQDEIPLWNDSMSDGCSIPHHLRGFIEITHSMRACCVRHDRRYYYGGSREDRLYADTIFLKELIEVGVSAALAEEMFMSVRLFGGPEIRAKFSWAFGGKRFCYDESRTGLIGLH